MFRFWKVFATVISKQIVNLLEGLIVPVVLMLAGSVLVGSGMLFHVVLATTFPVDEDTAVALSVLFVILWPTAIIWVVHTVIAAKRIIKTEDREIKKEIRSIDD